jgi:photosystem II stability/assembly factor-like uncharacterized protein
VSAGVNTTRFGAQEDIVSLVRFGSNLLAASEDNLYRSTDDGLTWFACGAPALHSEHELEGHYRQLAADDKTAHLSVGSSHFISADGGLSWTFAPGRVVDARPEALRISNSGFWSLSGGSYANLARSLDNGQTWHVIDSVIPIRHDDHEVVLSFAEAGGTLFVASSHGAIYVSRDKGQHFSRFNIGKKNGNWFPVGYRLWPVKDAVLAFTGYDLRRITSSGQTVLAYPREVIALGTQGNNVVALTARYLARSSDGGKTWKEERLTGPLDDSVQQVSASGQNVALVAHGPTAFVSSDGGETWSPGPDLGKSAQVLATDTGFLFSTDLDRAGHLAFSDKVGSVWQQVTLPDGWGQYAPRLVAAEHRNFVVISNGNYLMSKDCGQTWQALPNPTLPFGNRSTGLLNDGELYFAPSVGLERSINGGAFERITPSFPQDVNLMISQLFRESSTYYAVGSDLYAWRTGSKVEVLSDKLALSRQKHEYVQFAAAHGDQLLALVQSQGERRLHFSRNRGKSWKQVMIDESQHWVTALASADSGFLVGTDRQGLWLVTAQ